jgi:hypothetical protein
MTAALLCPGPSLRKTFDPDFTGLRVGVNAAAVAYPCEVWAALDYPMTRDHHEKVPGNPKWLTRRQTWLDIGKRVRFTDVTLTENLSCPQTTFTTYTATCALVLLAGMGVSEVKVYGADWKPDAPDFDGIQRGENRSAERFRVEREIWERVVAWMNGNGIGVERISGNA